MALRIGLAALASSFFLPTLSMPTSQNLEIAHLQPRGGEGEPFQCPDPAGTSAAKQTLTRDGAQQIGRSIWKSKSYECERQITLYSIQISRSLCWRTIALSPPLFQSGTANKGTQPKLASIGTTGACSDSIAAISREPLLISGQISVSKRSKSLVNPHISSRRLWSVLKQRRRDRYSMPSWAVEQAWCRSIFQSAKVCFGFSRCSDISRGLHRDRGGTGNPGAGVEYGQYVYKYNNFCAAHLNDGMAIYYNVPSMWAVIISRAIQSSYVSLLRIIFMKSGLRWEMISTGWINPISLSNGAETESRLSLLGFYI